MKYNATDSTPVVMSRIFTPTNILHIFTIGILLCAMPACHRPAERNRHVPTAYHIASAPPPPPAPVHHQHQELHHPPAPPIYDEHPHGHNRPPSKPIYPFTSTVVYEGDAGIWTVASLPLLEHSGADEIIALDDAGRCIVLSSYGGAWTPSVALQDGQWLGGLAFGDIDPRRAGNELYVGGKRGHLYQVWPHSHGGYDVNIIATLPGMEIHTIVIADLDSSQDGSELLVMTNPGALYQIKPDGDCGSSFTTTKLQTLKGRIRDAKPVVTHDGQMIGLATASHAGTVDLLRMENGTPAWTTLYQTKAGLGRIAIRPPAPDQPITIYITCDDGRITRLEQQEDQSFSSQIIYPGPIGPRGIVTGRFNVDPTIETIAVYGYSGKVELLTNDRNSWDKEIIYEDDDKGHWLAVGEFDGRNTTDEIILSGYGQRVIMLSRRKGYGVKQPRSMPVKTVPLDFDTR